jgi:hypothetical protein
MMAKFNVIECSKDENVAIFQANDKSIYVIWNKKTGIVTVIDSVFNQILKGQFVTLYNDNIYGLMMDISDLQIIFKGDYI